MGVAQVHQGRSLCARTRASVKAVCVANWIALGWGRVRCVGGENLGRGRTYGRDDNLDLDQEAMYPPVY